MCLGLLAVLLAACARRSSSATLAPLEQCAMRSWSTPVELRTTDNRPVYVEQPSPVRLRRGVGLLGDPTLVWASPDSFVDARYPDRHPFAADRPAGVLLRQGDVVELVDPPAAASRMLSVRALRGSDGVTHILWGSPPDTAPNERKRARTVWYARLDDGTWSTRERAFTAEVIWWDPVQASAILIGDQPHVAALSFQTRADGGLRSGIAYLWRRSGAWESTLLDAGGGTALSVALGAITRDRILLVYAGTVSTDVNHRGLALLRSEDGARSWLPPTILAASSSDNDLWPRVLRTGDDSVHVLWIARTGNRDHVRHLLSRDGVSWVEGPSLAVDQAVADFSAVVEGTALRLVFRSQAGLSTARWVASPSARAVASTPSQRGWSTVQPLAFAPVTSPPTLTSLGDTTYLTWGVPQFGHTRGSAFPRFHVSRLAHCSALR